eukprot:TRINITY_DN8917_c0_g1_i1.p1 TRINITY_DN8917_c0_g1~~TRINITY_DN8917_c0_g1_i1.p1  ORF type:complete len:222 (+),score=41.04 TRINITY_DN8917_c0_g1_i1:204-869(+)
MQRLHQLCRVIRCLKETPSTFPRPYMVLQQRGVKITGSEIKQGNIIERNGHLYEVIKSQHTQHGRGGAIMQVELRDMASGLKSEERFRPTQTIERVHVEDKVFTFLYEDGDTIFVMDPKTFEQVELSKRIFGKRAAYLTDGMQVTVSFHEGRALSASIPTRVICTIVEAEPSIKGQSATYQYKKLVLENGQTIMGPVFLNVGDKIVVNTIEETYMTRDSKR